MAYPKSPITPFEGGTLAHARALVLNAFATRDWEYIWEMLCLFYIQTSKIEIMEECEKTVNEVEQQLNMFNRKIEACNQPYLAVPIINARKSYLKKIDYAFDKQIMLLCAKHNLTEFDTVKPKHGSIGRLGSGSQY